MPYYRGNVVAGQEVSGARVRFGMGTETLVGARQISKLDYQWLNLSANSPQDVVLPDATTLTPGWAQTIRAVGTSPLTVKTFDALLPVTLREVAPGQTVTLVLLSAQSAAGAWQIEGTHINGKRFDFDIADWVLNAGEYRLDLAHGLDSLAVLFKIIEGTEHTFTRFEEINQNTLRLFVPYEPDGRFSGKIYIERIL